jgi:hypothetical protein
LVLPFQVRSVLRIIKLRTVTLRRPRTWAKLPHYRNFIKAGGGGAFRIGPLRHPLKVPRLLWRVARSASHRALKMP